METTTRTSRTGIHLDDVLDFDGTVILTLRCTRAHADDCNPGNCEDAHAKHFGI